MSDLMSRTEFENKIAMLVSTDESIRKRMIEDPKSTVEEILKIKLPEKINVKVHEENQETLHLVIPSNQARLEVATEFLLAGSWIADNPVPDEIKDDLGKIDVGKVV